MIKTQKHQKVLKHKSKKYISSVPPTSKKHITLKIEELDNLTFRRSDSDSSSESSDNDLVSYKQELNKLWAAKSQNSEISTTSRRPKITKNQKEDLLLEQSSKVQINSESEQFMDLSESETESIDDAQYKKEVEKLPAVKDKNCDLNVQKDSPSKLNSGENVNKKRKFVDDSDEESFQEGDEEDSVEENQELTEEKEYDKIKQKLSTMSFEEILAWRDKLGTKVYNQVVHGEREGKTAAKKMYKRENKNRPMEMSSKRTVSRYRDIVPVKKKISRDPRFDDLSGEYNEVYFKKNYSFLDDVKAREKMKIERKMKKEKNPDKKQELKGLFNRIKQQEISAQQKLKTAEIEKEFKEKELKKMKDGGTPFYLKKADRRKLELADKFKELKKSGKIDSYIKKKRKKNLQKEKKKNLV